MAIQWKEGRRKRKEVVPGCRYNTSSIKPILYLALRLSSHQRNANLAVAERRSCVCSLPSQWWLGGKGPTIAQTRLLHHFLGDARLSPRGDRLVSNGTNDLHGDLLSFELYVANRCELSLKYFRPYSRLMTSRRYIVEALSWPTWGKYVSVDNDIIV